MTESIYTNPEQAALHFQRQDVSIAKLGLMTSVAMMLTTLIVSLYFGQRADESQRALGAIEVDRHVSETTTGSATDFVMTYFSSTCRERVQLMNFPLDQWLNWRGDDLLHSYSNGGEPKIYMRIKAPTDGTAVMGQTQNVGEAPQPVTIDGAGWKRIQDQEASVSEKIRDAVKAGYTIDQIAPTPATTEEPVLANCLHGRSDSTNRIEPDIPTSIVSITPLGKSRGVSVVVNVASDSSNQDHVADTHTAYAVRLVPTADGYQLKSITGLAVQDDNASLIRELCALVRAQVELDPNFKSYSAEGKAGVQDKCRSATPK